MMKINFRSSILLVAIGLSLWACKDDDDDPANPSGPTNQPAKEVAISNLVNGNITTTLNPTGVAPLSAELTFNTVGNTKVEINVLGKLPISHAFETVTSSHAIPVLGLYPDTMNTVIIKVSNNLLYAYDTITIQTDSLPSVLPTIEIITADAAQMEEGMNINCLSITNGTRFDGMPLAYDRNGDIRWYLDLRGRYQAAGFISPWRALDNGLLLAEVGNQVIEFDMLGREQKVINMPSGYHSHHDVIKLPNGNYTVAIDKASSTMPWTDNGVTQTRTTVEDIFTEFTPGGAIVQEWDLKNVLDVDREVIVPSLQGNGVVDWFHMNAVTYSESDDTYILSGRNQGVVKVDRQGNVVWILSPHQGWEKAGANGNGHDLDSLLLTAINASGTPYDTSIQNGNALDPNFDWTWGQHAPMILPNGNIAIFDNGVNRILSGNNAPNYSRYVEYDIDETNMTIRQVRSYGETRPELYSFIISDVDYLPNTGNVMMIGGVTDNFTTSRIVELNSSNQVVFEGKMTFKNELSPGGPLAFGQLDLNYRSERAKLYR